MRWIYLSKEYFKSDGSRITVTNDNQVFDSNGRIGQIDQFGDFISADGSERYTIYDDGHFVGSSGNSGNVTHGSHIQMNEPNNQSTESSYSSSSSTITIPLWLKLILIFVLLPVMVALSMFKMFFASIFYMLYEAFKSGNWILLIIWIVGILLLISLIVFLVRKAIKFIKKKIK